VKTVLLDNLRDFVRFGLDVNKARELIAEAADELERLAEAPERIRNRGNDPYLGEYARGRFNGLTAAMAYMNGGEPKFLDYSKVDDGSIQTDDGTIRFVEVEGHIDRDFSTDDLITGEPYKQSQPSHPIHGSDYAENIA
jgi:hypothetical protein